MCTAIMFDCNTKECTLEAVWFYYVYLQQGGFHKIEILTGVVSGWCRFVPAISDKRAQHSKLWAKLLYELSIINTEFVALGFCAVGK